MSRKTASGQPSEAILRFPTSAHDGPQKVRDETKKCPRFKRAWTFAKTDVRYWQRTIFRQTYTRDGETRVTKDWAMKIAHVGRRETFPLGTPNKAAAAAKARDIYLLLVASGWEITLRRYKASLAVPKKVAANAERGQLVRLTKPRRKQARKKNDCQTGYRVEGAPRAPLLSRTAAFVRG